jgi:hypothetical protein
MFPNTVRKKTVTLKWRLLAIQGKINTYVLRPKETKHAICDKEFFFFFYFFKITGRTYLDSTIFLESHITLMPVQASQSQPRAAAASPDVPLSALLHYRVLYDFLSRRLHGSPRPNHIHHLGHHIYPAN